MKPIETKYAGRTFRSRLEARWAVYFDTLGVGWEYEAEGFELGNGVRYLPDFRTYTSYGVTVWWEIKPPIPIPEEEYNKIRRFAEVIEVDNAFFVMRGEPSLQKLNFAVAARYNEPKGLVYNTFPNENEEDTEWNTLSILIAVLGCPKSDLLILAQEKACSVRF